jgi:phosphate/sulfate permease
VLAAVFNLLGPLLVGGAVARAIGGIVAVDPSSAPCAGAACSPRRRGTC